MTIHIRDAVAEDGEALWQVHTESVQQGAQSHYALEEREAWAGFLTPSGYASSIARNPFLVAQDESGQVVGFAEIDVAAAEIEAVYVAPTHYRYGIGTQLLQTLENIALQHGLTQLFVLASLNAAPFYERAGYETIGEAVHPIRGSAIILRCLQMKKLLS
jgi:N-acetylglutamate synthase-like GNAT family acetyltransferase